MGHHTRRDERATEASKVRHDAERLRWSATKVDDCLAAACLIARARELEALATILEARSRITRRFTAGGGKHKG
jgi:hypothetical protein